MGMQSPSLGLIIFIILTISYFIVQYKTEERNSTVTFLIYILAVLSTQIWASLQLTKSLCGSIQAKPAILYTLFPWILIFGVLNLALILFPAWLKPFSNTFGYLIIKYAGGLNDVLKHIIKSKDKVPNNKGLSETLGTIYDDPSLLINEIPNAGIGFDVFWNDLSTGKLLTSESSSYKDSLRQLIRLKNIISAFIWFVLVGALTNSTTYNYLAKSACNLNVEEMEKRHSEYQRIVEKRTNEKQEPRVYKDFGN